MQTDRMVDHSLNDVVPGVRGRGAPLYGLEGTHSVAVLEVSGRAAVRWFSRRLGGAGSRLPGWA